MVLLASSAMATVSASDIPQRAINVLISEEELASRRLEQHAIGWKPAQSRTRKVSSALKAYSLLATSADRGRAPTKRYFECSAIRCPDVSQTQEVRYRELNGQQQILAEKNSTKIIDFAMRIHGCRDSLARGKPRQSI